MEVNSVVKSKVAFKKNKGNKAKLSPLTIAMLIFLILYVIVLFWMLGWGFITSLKNYEEWVPTVGSPNYIGFPDPKYFIDPKSGLPTFINNIVTLFTDSKIKVDYGKTTVYMDTMLLYSILYSIGCAFFNTFVPFVTAYAVTRYKNFLSAIIFGTAIVVMSIPIVGTAATEMELASALGLYNQIFGLWIMKANFLGIYFLVFCAAFKSIPKDYYEAAEIDGANQFRCMTRVGFPLCKGEFTTVFLINFITFWNDYQTPKQFMPNKPTLSYDLFYQKFHGDALLQSTPMQIMLAMIILLPVLILFLIFQKRLLTNLNVGGIKG